MPKDQPYNHLINSSFLFGELKGMLIKIKNNIDTWSEHILTTLFILDETCCQVIQIFLIGVCHEIYLGINRTMSQ